MSVKNLIEEIKSEGILRAGHKVEKLYDTACHNEQALSERDARIAALEAERDALAAELQNIKSFRVTLGDIRSSLVGGGHGYMAKADMQAQDAVLDVVLDDFDDIETPATDAFLRDQMAKGVEVAAASYHPLVVTGGSDDPQENGLCIREDLLIIAAKMRAGEAV